MGPYTNVVCPDCGHHTRVKCELGQYLLTGRHAAGGMSMVFNARECHFGAGGCHQGAQRGLFQG